MTKNNKKEGGWIVRWAIIIIAIILILSYFGFDLRTFFNSEPVVNNIDFVEESGVGFWDNFLKEPFEYMYDYLSPFLKTVFKDFGDPNSVGKIPDGLTDFPLNN